MAEIRLRILKVAEDAKADLVERHHLNLRVGLVALKANVLSPVPRLESTGHNTIAR